MINSGENEHLPNGMPTHPVGGMSACFSHGWVGLLAVAASLLLAGCARDLSSPLDIDTCRAGMVLAELEGQEITVRDFRARRSLETALVAYRKRDLPAQKTAGALAKFTEGRNRRILAELVNQALVKSYLEKAGGTRRFPIADSGGGADGKGRRRRPAEVQLQDA